MASDYGQRGQAAARLMKKGKGAPPEDDMDLPPEDGADAPPPEAGGGAPIDLAAMLGGAGGAPPPGEPPMDAGAPPAEGGMPGEEGGAPQPPDLDTALGGVESALDGIPPEAAEEIRVHLNAIREIASRGGQEQGEAPSGPEVDMGSDAMPPAPADKEAAS